MKKSRQPLTKAAALLTQEILEVPGRVILRHYPSYSHLQTELENHLFPNMLKAIDKWDPERGSLKSYVWAWCRYGVLDYLKRHGHEVMARSLDAPLPGTEDLMLSEVVADPKSLSVVEDEEDQNRPSMEAIDDAASDLFLWMQDFFNQHFKEEANLRTIARKQRRNTIRVRIDRHKTASTMQKRLA